MTDTTAYYDKHAAAFFAQTAQVDMTALHDRFLSHIQSNGLILDAGCGSGRDAKAFLARGFRVAAFDASPRLAQLAAEHLGQAVAVQTFTDVAERDCYDGIWACASLLHLLRRLTRPTQLRPRRRSRRSQHPRHAQHDQGFTMV